jgi:hypothetical protein
MSNSYFVGIDRTHTVDYEGDDYAIIAYLGDMLLVGNPNTDNFWIHTSKVMYNGEQNPPSIPSY